MSSLEQNQIVGDKSITKSATHDHQNNFLFGNASLKDVKKMTQSASGSEVHLPKISIQKFEDKNPPNYAKDCDPHFIWGGHGKDCDPHFIWGDPDYKIGPNGEPMVTGKAAKIFDRLIQAIPEVKHKESAADQVGNVAKEVISGIADEVINHPWELAKNALIGTGIAVGGALLAPEIAIGLGVAGAGLGIYELAKNAPGWMHSIQVTADPNGHSTKEINAAHKNLHNLGRGSADLAAGLAGGLGGSAEVAMLRAAGGLAAAAEGAEANIAARMAAGAAPKEGLPFHYFELLNGEPRLMQGLPPENYPAEEMMVAWRRFLSNGGPAKR